MDYQEIKLNKFRNVISFSFCFITFFGAKIHFTKEFCNFVRLRQQKIKTRTSYLNEYDYQIYWLKKYKWVTINIE